MRNITLFCLLMISQCFSQYATYNWNSPVISGLDLIECAPNMVGVDTVDNLILFVPSYTEIPSYQSRVYAFDYITNSLDTLPANSDSIPAERKLAVYWYDYKNNIFLQFSGGNDSGNLNDLWGYSTPDSEWQRIFTRGTPPVGRHGAAWIYDPIYERMILFGGRISAPSGGLTEIDDCWALMLSNFRWIELNDSGEIPSMRSSPAFAYDPFHRQMIIFGGHSYTDGFLNDLYGLDLDTEQWFALPQSGDIPSPRRLSYFALLEEDTALYLFGGDGSLSGGPLGGLYRLDLQDYQWTEIFPEDIAPSDRSTYGWAKIPGLDEIILIAGVEHFWYFCDDIYLLNWSDDILNTPKIQNSKTVCSPNPFNNSVEISLVNEKNEHFDIDIYNCQGKIVERLYSGMINRGVNRFYWHPSKNLTSGFYFVKSKSPTYSSVDRILLFH